MYIVAWADGVFPESDENFDHWEVFGNLQEARDKYDSLLEQSFMYCIAISKIVDGTEPQWLDDEEV